MQQHLPITIESQAPEPVRAPTPRAHHVGDWRIDDRTRHVGLRGVARARAALHATGTIESSCQADAA